MKKILFLKSNFNGYNYDVTLGHLSLATILDAKGYEVKIIDCLDLYKNSSIKRSSPLKERIKMVAEYLLSESPDVIDFYTMCHTYHISVAIAKIIKETNPEIKIIFGGPQASLTAYESLKAFSFIDVIGIGEGEKNIEDIIIALTGSCDMDKVNGIAYRKEGEVVCNNKCDLIENLDDLPYLNYDLLNLNMKELPSIPIESGRGCPFTCSYCSTKIFWKRKFRLKSIDRLINEIRTLKEKYECVNIDLNHDLFTFNKKKVIEFSERLIEENLKIKWSCSSRIDTLDEEIIEKMAAAGLEGIYIGIETGSKRMQKLINKNLNLDDIFNKLNSLKKHKVKVTLSFIYGFPEETDNDFKDTMNMIGRAIDHKIHSIQLHRLWILAGTELFNEYKDKLILDNVFSDIDNYTDDSEMVKMIESNKYIFPEYHKFPSITREKYKFIDKFVLTICGLFSDLYNSTYTLLMKYYNNDLLSLYIDFERNCTRFDQIKDLSYEKLTVLISENRKEFKLFRSNTVKNFIENKKFNDLDKLIKEVFSFEYDMVYFMNNSVDKNEIQCSYDLDVYKIKALGYDEKHDYSTGRKLKFYRTESGNLKVQLLKAGDIKNENI